MPKQKMVVTGLLAFLAGCATAAVTHSLVSRPARAQVAGPRWDYLCFEAEHAEEVTRQAKHYGQFGWEMVTTGNGTGNWNNVWCFKRPM
jgi:hypothetical protein